MIRSKALVANGFGFRNAFDNLVSRNFQEILFYNFGLPKRVSVSLTAGEMMGNTFAPAVTSFLIS